MEGKFVCKDCGVEFETAANYSDHFKREGIRIIGCNTKPLAEVLEESQLRESVETA